MYTPEERRKKHLEKAKRNFMKQQLAIRAALKKETLTQ